MLPVDEATPMAGPQNCPCHSGERYEACCAPFHRGTRAAPTPERLMRSRYAAFALKLVPYLYATFHSEHEDRKLPKPEVLRGLRDAAEGFRYVGLKIIEAREEGERGQVLFFARLFERGIDRSFVELSEFRKEDGAWRYLSGQTYGLGAVRGILDNLSIDNLPAKKGA